MDSSFSFEDHMNSLCKKSSEQQLNALARIALNMCLEKHNYESDCNIPTRALSLVLMFHNRGTHNKANYLFEQVLRTINGDESSLLQDLLKMRT